MTQTDFVAAIAANRDIEFSEAAQAPERTIAAAWLQDALLEDVRIPPIRNALIHGKIGILSAVVKSPLLLDNCQVQALIADYSTFNGVLILIRCSIGVARFRGTKFERAVLLRNSQIGSLDLAYGYIGAELDLDSCILYQRFYAAGLHVEGNFHARGAAFLGTVESPLIQVGGQCDLNDSLFQGNAQLLDGNFGALTAQGTTFLGTVIFDRSVVASSAFFTNSRFEGMVQFGSFIAHGQFVINKAIFGSNAHFEGLQAGDFVALDARFYGNVSFIGCKLFSCALDGAVCFELVEFHDASIAVGASFRGTRWHNNAMFERMKIGSTIRFDVLKGVRTTFFGLVSFSGTSVGAQMLFDEVTFSGDVIFESVQIGADLQLDNCDLWGNLKFVGASTVGNADFGRSRFLGDVDATNAKIGEHALFWMSTFVKAPKFIRTTVGSTLNFSGARIERGMTLDYANVAVRTIFLGSRIFGTIRARMARLNTVVFDAETVPGNVTTTWAFSTAQFDLGGLVYDRIDVHWRPFMAALSRGSVGADIQPYLELEKSLRNIGRNDWADTVYFEARKQAVRIYAYTSPFRLGDAFRRGLSGYGVRAHWLFSWIVVLIVAISGFFLIPGAARPTIISPTAYSCDRAPAAFQALGLGLASLSSVGAKVVDGWTISDCPIGPLRVKPFTVVGLGQILGLTLIPFLVAQLTSLLRYSNRRS